VSKHCATDGACLAAYPREALGLPPTNIVFTSEYIFSPLRGFWETAVDPGDRAEKGTILGRLHFPEELEREPEKIVAPFDGYVVGSRAVVPARPGDVLVTYGYEVSVDAIMAGTV
jgi:predicted deacylase